MAADPEAVTAAADHYADYQVKHIDDERHPGAVRRGRRHPAACSRARGRDCEQGRQGAEVQRRRRWLRIRGRPGGGQGHAASAAFDQIIAEYDKALVAIGQQVEAARKARARRHRRRAAGSRPRAVRQPPRRATANRQLLAAYHNAALIEVEQLFALSEDTAKWAAARYKDRTINFKPID